MLRLIDDKSPSVQITLGTTTLQVQPMSHERITELRDLHLPAGQKSSKAFRSAMFSECIVGWTGLLDSKGVEIPFDAGRAGFVGQHLPDQVALRVLGAARRGSDEVEEALGN